MKPKMGDHLGNNKWLKVTTGNWDTPADPE